MAIKALKLEYDEKDETKVIFAGQLEFGTNRNFENVQSQYMHRMENFYKNDILLKPEDIFNEDDYTMDIPRTVVTATDRRYNNTVNLMERMSSFSMAGDLNIWRLNGDGKVIDHKLFEPRKDRTAAQLFLEGRKMLDQEDSMTEARELLTQAIEKFERHATAYERRGFTNYKLGNYKDALYDLSKSIRIYSSKPDTYYGRGLIYLLKEKNIDKAIEDFGMVAKYAIPHQPVYWQAKRMRSDAFYEAGRVEEAIRELTAFVSRKHKLAGLEKYDRLAAFKLGELLEAKGEHEKASHAFKAALEAPADKQAPEESVIEEKLSVLQSA
ncbi:MAG: tetratricopeptide repeat protein [Bacteroidota bacterium]